MAGSWRREVREGDAATLHAGWPTVLDRPDEPAVAVCRVTAPAVVLGSSQPESVIDAGRAAAAGISVARRRSGGGAVLVIPGDPVWVDVWVPVGHPLWSDDVVRAFDWLGNAWTAGLRRSGITLSSARGPAVRSDAPWRSLACFGSVGAGEVVTDDGRKVVGLAQRRDRLGAWFHGAGLVRWDAGALVDTLALAPDQRAAARRGLGGVAVGVHDLADEQGAARPPVEDIAAAVIASLP
jgi:lipoate---protein ligase